jgi:hypothetical protein
VLVVVQDQIQELTELEAMEDQVQDQEVQIHHLHQVEQVIHLQFHHRKEILVVQVRKIVVLGDLVVEQQQLELKLLEVAHIQVVLVLQLV